jgi:hypothetical protein
VPDDFLQYSREITTVRLPGGRVEIEEPNLFSSDGQPAAKIGSTILFRGSREQVTYLAKLSSWGVSGDVTVPTNSSTCRKMLDNIGAYQEEFSNRFRQSVEEVTSDAELQARILREGWKRVVIRN